MFRITAGRVLLSVVSAWTAIGPYVFDWNETHIYNPSWPAHAKFHNAQTMSYGALGGIVSVATLWSRRGAPSRAQFALAAGAESAFWVTQVSALAYPGSKMQEPPETGKPQLIIASVMLGLTGAALALGTLGRR